MPPDQPSLKTRLAHVLFGDIIRAAVAEATAAVGARTELSRSVSSRVDDVPGWNRLSPAGSFERLRTGSHDRDFGEWYQGQGDAHEAWRKHFNEQRVHRCSPLPWPVPMSWVRTTSVRRGSTISSDHACLLSFVAAFAAHPKNRLAERYGPICDELTRGGQILPVPFARQERILIHHPFLRRRQRHRACLLRPCHPRRGLALRNEAHIARLGPD